MGLLADTAIPPSYAHMKELPLDSFDFSELSSPDFKEDAVREEIVKPILDALGYSVSGKYKIQRSKKLRHPFVKTASGKRRITIFPDYILSVDGKHAWVLDAKSPDEQITAGENREQVYFYAIHPDVRAKLYGLCNGKEFVVFAIDESDPVLYFQVSELPKHYRALAALLSPRTFAARPAKISGQLFEADFDYAAAKPLQEIVSEKQRAKRHFGVHPYFTRQAWNVVQEYIKNYTKPGDLILDPFGGSGVTAVEALMLGRRAIHIDLNPLCEFMVKNLIQPIDVDELTEAFDDICGQLRAKLPKSDSQVDAALARYPYPKGIRLPKSSDVEHIEQLFSRRQLAELSFLKALILKQEKQPIRDALLLMFSGLINKVNLTYHSSEGRSEGRGDSAVFRYYRYRLAPEPARIDLIKYFGSRLKKLLAAKAEMAASITSDTVGNAEIRTGSATDLSAIGNETVDYIYTDPPYGAKIPYLDLSVMWTAWLDLDVSDRDYELEAIEGGERRKTKADYSQLIEQSIKEMYRVLKYDRWMSFVFQHKEPAYWHLIVDAAERAGFEYMGTVTQKIGQTSFKKRQHPFTVLHGQLIINFKKARNPQALIKLQLGYETAQLVMQFIEAIIAKNQGATLEEIYNELIVRGMELGFLYNLAKEQTNVAALLHEHFDFNVKKQVYQIRKNTKFKTQIPLQVRVKYYLIAYMRQMQRQDVFPGFDEIILNIMPLLKNGITPEHQTILNVLERVAERVGADRWRLVEDKQLLLDLTDVVVPKKGPRSAVLVESKSKTMQ